MTKRVAYLGPIGTYTEQAAVLYAPDAEFIPRPSFPEVARAVESGEADEGVMAIENSLEGQVTFTVDVLIHDTKLLIRNEIAIPIHHLLLSKPETQLDQIEVVYSHPQALAQSKAYMERHLPNAIPLASLSTTLAVEEMQKSDRPAAAISGARSAELYNATILASNIEDNSSNQTRFVIVSKEDHPPTGTDKTSICFSFGDDSPGILYSVMGEIASRGINLNKIESRPTRESLGRYIFLIDIDGHRKDPIISEALEQIQKQVSMFRILGSYPRHVSSHID